MTCIGTFKITRDGFSGRLRTLTIDCALTLVASEHADAGNAPDYRVLAGDGDNTFEVGAGWKRTGDKAGAYVAVLIDDPALLQQLRANLFRSEQGEHVLMWSRGPRREARD